jgi:hypothetical protein
MDPIFYTLPARCVEEGMSTADGQDVIEVDKQFEGQIGLEVYTPYPEDPEQDEENLADSHYRLYPADERLHMAVFEDTEVDGSKYDEALPLVVASV